MPEAAGKILRFGFETLGMNTIWYDYYKGNEKSGRVQEKTGFQYHHACDSVPVPPLQEVRIDHTNYMTRMQWEEKSTNG